MSDVKQIREAALSIVALCDSIIEDTPNVGGGLTITDNYEESNYLEPFGHIRRRADEHYARGQVKAGDMLMERYHEKRGSGSRSDLLL